MYRWMPWCRRCTACCRRCARPCSASRSSRWMWRVSHGCVKCESWSHVAAADASHVSCLTDTWRARCWAPDGPCIDFGSGSDGISFGTATPAVRQPACLRLANHLVPQSAWPLPPLPLARRRPPVLPVAAVRPGGGEAAASGAHGGTAV
jgi:hypothetical protein